MRASGPLPLPGHLTPALLLPAVQLSTTALSCSCELLLLLHLTEKLPALSFSAAATTLYICATPHTSGEYLCHPHLPWQNNNCQVYKLLHLRSIFICGGSLLLQPFHPSPSAAITPNYPPPLATLLATCQPTLSETPPPPSG